MHGNNHLRFAGLFLFCLIAAFGVDSSANTATAATYVYSPTMRLLFFSFNYDLRKIHFQRAPIPMIAPVFPVGATFSFYGPKRQVRDKPLDLNGLPFWIYAEYRDSESKCQYDFIGGLMPDRYKPLPEMGDVPVGQDPADWVVVRNCGRGFALVSREGYDGGMFDGSGAFLSYLKGTLPIGDIDEVRKGLMRDYVQRLLHAFGGKAALQNKLDEGFKQPPFKEHPHHTTEFLASALVAAGIRIQ